MFIKKRRLKRQGGGLKKGLFFLFLCIVLSLIASYLYLHLVKSTKYFNPVLNLNLNTNSYLSEKLSKANIGYKKIEEGEGFTRVVLNDNSEVIFSSKKDLSQQVSSLQLTLSRLTIDGKKLKSLDFRFDSPVISFK